LIRPDRFCHSFAQVWVKRQETSRQFKNKKENEMILINRSTTLEPMRVPGGVKVSGPLLETSNTQEVKKASLSHRFARAAQKLVATLAFSAVLGTALAPRAGLADDREKEKGGARILRFDVAENAKRFIFDDTPLVDNGAGAKVPGYANEFITEGYIYPYGTLDATNGVLADGSPQFPDKVMGRWSCRGWHVGDGALTKTGPWVITHQLYDFGNTPGNVTLTTDGLELVDVNVPIRRAIIGGTGPYAQARGEAIQTMLGFNQLQGVNLRFVLNVKD
jgi:hypothetical protein